MWKKQPMHDYQAQTSNFRAWNMWSKNIRMHDITPHMHAGRPLSAPNPVVDWRAPLVPGDHMLTICMNECMHVFRSCMHMCMHACMSLRDRCFFLWPFFGSNFWTRWYCSFSFSFSFPFIPFHDSFSFGGAFVQTWSYCYRLWRCWRPPLFRNNWWLGRRRWNCCLWGWRLCWGPNLWLWRTKQPNRLEHMGRPNRCHCFCFCWCGCFRFRGWGVCFCCCWLRHIWNFGWPNLDFRCGCQ